MTRTRTLALLASLAVALAGCKKSDAPAPAPTVQKAGSGFAPPELVAQVTGSGTGSDSGSVGSASGNAAGSAGVAIAGSAAPSATGSAAGSATEADPWRTPEAKKDPIKRPLFWAVEKAGKTSYLLGTIHIGVDAETRLPQIVFDKLDAAKIFAMETDTSDPSLANMGKRSQGTLKDDLGPDYWKKLEAALGANVASAINDMKPLIAATLLSLRGLPKTAPMDGVLHARATNKRKQIVFLESAQSQAAVLEKHMNLKALKMMLDEPDKGPAQTKEMLAAYANGDDAKFITLGEQQRQHALAAGYTAAEYDEFMDDINYKRNAKWIPTIEQIHASGPAFIAVGALHLIGKRSVIDLLQQKGYTVTRVTP